MSPRYRIVRLIDRGPMSAVYEGRIVGDAGFERKVALKTFTGTEHDEVDAAHAFIDEARIASCLHHPNIVAVLDFGVMEGAPLQVLEWVDGPSLAHLIRARGALPPEVALHVAIEVAHGLEHAHQAVDEQGQALKIVHRDVSCDNVLISHDGSVKLSDFGIALAEERLVRTRVGVTKGKLDFMAPEQQLGGRVDARADLFSLGCVLHAALTGRSPVHSTEARLAVISGAEVRIDGSLPDDLKTILHKALRTDPRHRYDSATELADHCGEALAKRLRRDARGHLREFLKEETQAASNPGQRLAEQMFVEVVPVERIDSTGIRRFTSVALSPGGDEASRLAALDAPTLTGTGPRSVADVQEGVWSDRTVTKPEVPPAPGRKTRVLRVAPHAALEEVTPRSEVAPIPRDDSPAPPPGTVTAPGGPPQSGLRVGETIQGYRLVREISRTPTAVLFQGQHELLPRASVFKVALAKDAAAAEGLVQEARCLTQLDHPTVVRLLDFGVTSSQQTWICLEWVPGVALDELLRTMGPLDPDRAALMIRQIAMALALAHARGVTHGALSVRQVMLVPGGPEGDLAKVGGWGSQPGTEAKDLLSLGQIFVGALGAAPEGSQRPGPSRDQVWRQLALRLAEPGSGAPLAATEVVRWIDAELAASAPSGAAHRQRTNLMLLGVVLAAGVLLAVLLFWPVPGQDPTGARGVRGASGATGRARPARPAVTPQPLRPPPRDTPSERAPTEPEPEASPPPPRAPPPAVTEPAPRPGLSSAARLSKARRTLQQSLQREGLTSQDLSGPQVQAFVAAVEAQDAAAAQHALRELLPLIKADEAIVRRKLDRAAQALRSASTKLPKEELVRLEDSYLANREAADRTQDWRSVARALTRLEGELKAALR